MTGTITNDQLAGSIANAKLANSTVSFGGVSLALGGSDATPAFDLTNATNYPTSSLTGTITNDQLAGSIANAKLANSTMTINGSSRALGDSFKTRNIAYVLSSSLDSVVTTTSESEQTPSGYNVSITPSATTSKVKVSMNIGYITSWEADQTISFHLYRGNSKIAEDLYIGNGNAAGPAVGKWHFDYIDSPSSTDATTYTLKYTLNGSSYDYLSGILGSTTGVQPITGGNTYKMSNTIMAEELF